MARASSAGLCLLMVASGALNVAAPGLADASPSAPVAFVDEPFTGAGLQVPSDWEVPSVPSGTNAACLTALTATSTTIPVPACGGTHDVAGNGALRLTGAATGEEGGVADDVALPSAQGLDITFDTYQYASSASCNPISTCAADGIMFFLAAANPADPQPPTTLGEPGGYLAYSGNTTGGGPGLDNGYLGVGLDEFGNYTNSNFDGAGCSDPFWAGTNNNTVPNEVSVRGPGSTTSGYCLLSSTAAEGLQGQLATGATGTRSTSEVPVEVALNPTGTAYSTHSGLSVPAYSYVVAVTPLGGATQLVSGTLPYDSYLPSSDSSWLYPSTGIPRQLVLGFAASTGQYDEIHEITNVQASPLASQPPQLGLTLSDTEAGALVKGTSDLYTATGLVASTGGPEASAPTLVATFPTGVAPGSASGTNWTCATASATVSCNYTGPVPISAGSSLSAVSIPATVATNAAGAQEVGATLWESGDVVAQASDTGAPVAAAQGAPILGLTFSDNAAGQLAQGETVTYTATGQVSSEGGADNGPISLAATLPSDESIATASGTNWSCVTSAPTVTCTWTGGNVAAGSALAPVAVQVTVGNDASGASAASATLSSPSASPGSVTDDDESVVASTPTLDVAVTDSDSGNPSGLTPSDPVDYTVNASVSASGWNEADAPAITDNFPRLFSSVTEDVSSTYWSCAAPVTGTAAITETCSYTGSLPIAAGTSLQPLQFDNIVSSSANPGATADDSVAVQSSDAPVAVATDYARIGEPPAPNLAITASAPSSATSSYTLALNAYVLATGGGASHHLIVAATLPTDESFTSASGSGWSCTISGGNGSLSCNTTTAISAGTALPTIQAEVDPSGVGLHTAQVTLADSLDGAFSVATSSTTESPLPVLVLGASPMTAQAAAGGSYTLSLSGSTSPAGGEVWNTLALVVTLPNYESFPAAPASSGGWSCTVPGTNDQQLNCTYAVSTPLAPGTALAAVAPVVDVSGSATGTLTATAMLEDAGDGATSAEQQPSVTVTATPVLSLSTTGTPTGASAGSTYQVTFTSSVASGGPAYNEPSLSVTLPSGESFLATAPTPAGWNCTVPGGGPTYQALDCTATAAIPIVAGTSLGGVQATVAISSSAPLTTLTTTASLADTADGATAATASAPVLVTAPPGLTLTMSPTTSPVAANTSYQIQLSPRLNSTGPAYHDPQLTVTLSAGETFATPAPAPTGWGTCAISTGGTVLSCTSTKLGTISAGSPLGGVTATVDIGPAASGGLGFETTASLSDAADAATPATTNQTVQVTPSPVLVLTTWGTPAGATVDNSYTLNLAASLSNAGGPAYHDPALTVTLPAGETFATPAPAPAGWGTCVISSGGTVLSCTSTHSVTISAGTSLGTVAATVDVGTGASGVLTTTAGLSDLGDGATTVTQAPSVTITTPPILALALAMSIGSSPAGAVAGTQYTLTIEPSVGGSSGPAYNEPTLVVTLPTGETFTPPGTTPNGWDCVISSNDTTLTCTSSDPTPIAAGGSLGNIQMTVVIASGARGTLTTNASLADSSDDATAAPTAATVLVTGAPVFALTTSGTPASASAPSTYTLTLTPSLRASGGTAWNDPVLTATLPTGETFQSPVPTPAGWSCAYSSANSDLQCTSTAAPVTAGSALGPVSVTVDIASSASGTLTTIVTLSDSTDLATPITLEPAVGITPPAPPSGGPEPPPVPIPSPTTTTTSGTSTSTTSTSTTSTSTTSTTSTSTTSTTTVSSTTTTAPGGGGKAGTGPLQTPVLPPVLKIVASAPKSVAAGTSFTLKLSVSLATNGGPAYHDPAFSVDLPANTSFATPAPSSSDWSCTVATGYAVLTCTWKAKVPQRAGASLGSITARVNVAPDASGRATVEANVADTADAARSAQASATIEITPAPGTPGGPPGPKGPGAGGAKSAGTSYYGYRLVAADGGVFSFGDASYSGSCEQKTKPCGPRDKVTVSALASSPKAKGYWLAARSGAVYTFGGAHNYGSCPEDKRVCGTSRSPIVGMAAAANGKGYWLVAANGTVFAFGSATGHGSCATSVKACGKVHAAVVGMVATPDGKGYWLVEKTGKVVPFGDARAQSRCSTSAKSCGQHLGVVTGIAAAATGQGYWLVNTAGRVYASGSAKFLGDVYTANAEKGLRGTIVGITAMPSGAGYWLVSSDGLVIAAKGTKFLGDAYTAKVKKLNHPMVGIAYT